MRPSRERPQAYDERGNPIDEPDCSDISGIGIKKLYDINKKVIAELIFENGKKKVILAYDNGRPKGMVFFENGTVPIHGSFVIPIVNVN